MEIIDKANMLVAPYSAVTLGIYCVVSAIANMTKNKTDDKIVTWMDRIINTCQKVGINLTK